MPGMRTLAVDVVVFGGGVAGLWLLDELVRRGYRSVLLESQALGSGQSIASQGIIHGGVKYTLTGLLTASAEAIREMPRIWRACHAGEIEPRLTGTRLRGAYCYLWRTDDLRSRFGMLGARAGLRVAPVRLERAAWPNVLQDCPGSVYRLDEQVFDIGSLVADFAQRNAACLLSYDATDGPEVQADAAGGVRLCVRAPGVAEPLELRCRTVVLAAGAGNAALRARCGLTADTMQLRPLHMVLLRGKLPPLHGHCTDGARTRVTITWTQDRTGRDVWQVGGQVSEDGVALEPRTLVAHAQAELRAAIPGLHLRGVEWSTYRVDRAEPRTRSGLRPDDAWCARDGDVLTVWPTKLALAPRLAELVLQQLQPPAAAGHGSNRPLPADWPRPLLALPPWEEPRTWYADV